MPHRSFGLLLLAILAAVCGFSGIAGGATGVARFELIQALGCEPLEMPCVELSCLGSQHVSGRSREDPLPAEASA